MSNIEIPSDNPTFKEKSSYIDISKFKPDSNNTLQFSKFDELEGKFDALKSPVTRELSNLANKLDSLSLVLNETSKTLEKLDVSNSKLLKHNFELVRKGILSKDRLINYLMETQTTILNLVSSAKNQKKTQEKLQKLNVPQQQQQNIQSQHIQQHFSHEHSTCQNQPQSEHEIFPTNFRTQNSKESNSQNTLKTLYVGNLIKSISEEDLYGLFGLRNTTYLKENCYERILSKSGLWRGFAFITAPDHVSKGLIKLNGVDFKSHHLTIEEVLVKPKAKQPSPSGNKTTEIKNYQIPFEEVPEVLGGESCSKATRTKNSIFNTIIFTNRIPKGIQMHKFNRLIKIRHAKIFYFPVASSHQ